MVETTRAQADREKVWHLIKGIGIALLVSHGADGKLHARPLAAAQKTFDDGRLWFMTGEGMPKLDEIEADSRVLLVYSDVRRQSYVTVTGTAEIKVDREKTKEIWQATQRLWFPQGPDEPDIRLICVSVESAEYWDRPSSPLVYAFHYLKTWLTGRSPGLIGANKVVYF